MSFDAAAAMADAIAEGAPRPSAAPAPEASRRRASAITSTPASPSSEAMIAGRRILSPSTTAAR